MTALEAEAAAAIVAARLHPGDRIDVLDVFPCPEGTRTPRGFYFLIGRGLIGIEAGCPQSGPHFVVREELAAAYEAYRARPANATPRFFF